MSSEQLSPRVVAAMPWVFVAIWSTGFVAARLGMPHAPPINLLNLRFALSTLCFAIWVYLAKAAWPSSRRQVGHLVVLGVLSQACYLCAGWAAVKHGLGAGTMSLIAGLQPLLTALWLNSRADAKLRGERLQVLQWAGLTLGLAGLVLVVASKLGLGEVTALNLSLGVAALLAITAGTLYQKHFVGPCDPRSAMLVQMLAATLLTLPLTPLEPERIIWAPELMTALAWSVLGLTLGGSSLLYMLLQRGAATKVTSLMYLIPPGAALMAWLLFGEPVSVQVWLGMGMSALGVYWVMRR